MTVEWTAVRLLRRWPLLLLRWLRQMHRPFDVMADQTVAWCRWCDGPWPCDEVVRLTRLLDAREVSSETT